MKVHTIQKVFEYKGSKIYIRRLGSMFEYITPINGEIYQAHIVVRNSFYRTILGLDYRKEVIVGVVNALLPMAEATIDYVLEEQATET